MTTKTVYQNIEVDIDLSEFDTDDLIEELESRGLVIEELESRGLDYNTTGVDADEMRQVLYNIWNKRRTNQDYQVELDKLIYGVLGKLI